MSAPVKKCEVTPLEALRRLYEVARKVDASEAGDFETLLQGELAVVEAVLRDAAMGKIIDQIADTWPMKKYTLEEIEDGLRALVANPANFAPSAAPVVPVAAQPVVQQEPKPRMLSDMVAEWEAHQRIADIPAVDEALRDFSDDPTGDNAVYIVREVLKVAAPSLEAQPAGEVENDVAKAIFKVIKPSNMIDKDWDSDVILGLENSFRDQIKEAAKAAINAMAQEEKQ